MRCGLPILQNELLMKTSQYWSRVAGLAWAILMIALAWRMPMFSSWTIDDGVKRIAAASGQGLWHESIPAGPLRALLRDPDSFSALQPPFAISHHGTLTVGFSPLARLYFAQLSRLGDFGWRFATVIAAVICWLVMERSGIRWAFLLLPLTFYGLIPWEHGLSWLLLWPSLWWTFGQGQVQPIRPVVWMMAGCLWTMAFLLRAETLISGLIIVGFLLWKRRIRNAVWLAAGGIAWLLVFLAAFMRTSKGDPWIQLHLNSLNSPAWPGLVPWLAARGETVYGLLLRSGGNTAASLLIIGLIFAGIYLIWRVENKQNPVAYAPGLFMLLIAFSFYQYRLWASPFPPLALMEGNSLFICIPWALMALLPPYRRRPAAWAAAAGVMITVLMTPVWEGVHWGPRLLLWILPLLAIDLFQSRRTHGILFFSLLLFTLGQTVSGAVLVHARNQEIAIRCRLTAPKMRTPVICPTMSQCADLAPLWHGREFFTAANPQELRDLLTELRAARVDTIWLHTDARDPLYEQTFPQGTPVTPLHITFLQAKTLYTTQWRLLELAMNRGDSAWAPLLESQAGRSLREGNLAEALQLQREVINLAPKSAQAHHNLALLLWQNGQPEEAEIEAHCALQLNPSQDQTRELLTRLADPAATEISSAAPR
jgi:hypothetical protein